MPTAHNDICQHFSKKDDCLSFSFMDHDIGTYISDFAFINVHMLHFENAIFDTVGIVGSSIHCFYWCSRFQQSFQKRASKASCICLSVIVASVLLGKQVLRKEKMGNCLDVSIALKSLWQPWCIEFSSRQSLPLDWFISICEAFVPGTERKN